LSTFLVKGVFRTLVLVQCIVAIAALYFSRTFDGHAEQLLEALQFLLLIGVASYVALLQHAMRGQVSTREETERELRHERHTLEKRVDERTAELRAEVSERRRAEQLNRDRNRVLEMLVRDEDTPKILQALTEEVAHHSTSLSCALHLLDGDTLTLAAQSSLPSTLAGRLQQIATGNLDAPNAWPSTRRAFTQWGTLARRTGRGPSCCVPMARIRFGRPRSLPVAIVRSAPSAPTVCSCTLRASRILSFSRQVASWHLSSWSGIG
jgi:hypothetical protein